MFGVSPSGTLSTVNIATGASRPANAADVVGYPSDTYATLSTVLGNYGGENESTNPAWPHGLADTQFDFWSPIVANTSSTVFGDITESLRFAIINSQRNSSVDGQITNAWIARDVYEDFLNIFDNKEQIYITSENSLRALGFKNTFQYDGIEVSWEAAVPTGVGYGMNLSTTSLKSMDSTLLRVEGPEYDIHTQSFNAVVSTLSNLKFKSPRNCFKLAALA
jgi:hypothetical protein